jgi:hypothetical protein
MHLLRRVSDAVGSDRLRGAHARVQANPSRRPPSRQSGDSESGRAWHCQLPDSPGLVKGAAQRPAVARLSQRILARLPNAVDS